MAVVAVAALGALVAGCGDDGSDKADDKPATTTVVVAETLITSSTGESIVGVTVTTVTATTAPPPTTLPVGLPADLGIPPAGGIALGPSSSLSNAITVRGVPLAEVIAFVRQKLAELGWAVNPDLTFVGPGAVGQATVAQVGDDVEIQLVLSGAPQ